MKRVSEIKEEIPMNNMAPSYNNLWGARKNQTTEYLILAVVESDIEIKESVKASRSRN